MKQSDNALIKPVSELGVTEGMPTKETWKKFKQENPYASVTGGYTDATLDILQQLEKVVTLTDFDQMKEELTKLYVERYEFLSYALNHPW